MFNLKWSASAIYIHKENKAYKNKSCKKVSLERASGCRLNYYMKLDDIMYSLRKLSPNKPVQQEPLRSEYTNHPFVAPKGEFCICFSPHITSRRPCFLWWVVSYCTYLLVYYLFKIPCLLTCIDFLMMFW